MKFSFLSSASCGAETGLPGEEEITGEFMLVLRKTNYSKEMSLLPEKYTPIP